MEIYTLSAIGFEYLEGKIKRLNKKAEKLGLAPLEFVNVKRYEEYKKSKSDLKDYDIEQKVDFQIKGEKPSLGGYKVIASLENADGKNVIKIVLNEREEGHDLNFYRDRVECDHCNHNRKRKHTYVLQKESTGEYIQVGRTCLGDFLEGDIRYLIDYAALDLENIEEDVLEYEMVLSESYIGIESFLCMTIEYVNNKGYKNSRTITPTGESVWKNFHPVHKEHVEYSILDVNEKNKEEANKIVKWAKGLKDETNDYLYNLSVIAESEKVTASRIGYVSSMVISYRKTLEKPQDKKREEKEKKKEYKESNYVGELGNRIELKVKVKNIYRFEGYYGTTDIVLFEDTEGNIFKWKTGSKHGFDRDQEVVIVGTVKEHEEYRDVKQTTLTRVKNKK